MQLHFELRDLFREVDNHDFNAVSGCISRQLHLVMFLLILIMYYSNCTSFCVQSSSEVNQSVLLFIDESPLRRTPRAAFKEI